MLHAVFTYDVNRHFKTFSAEHLFAMFMVFSFWTALILLTKRYNKLNKTNDNRNIRYTLAVLLVISESSNTVWHIATGHFSINDSLPLQLCGLTIFTCALMLITRNYFLFEFNCFAGLGGALQAIITPDITRNFPHFEFFQLFIAHAFIIASVLYMVFILKYFPTLKSALKAFILTNILMVIMLLFNYITGSNYMYVSRAPEFPSLINALIDIFGPHPRYIIGLELICALVYALLLVPFILRNRFHDSQKGGKGASNMNKS
jgi:hypothetical integral membrane protein (TIGR02206 family)